MLKSGQLPFDFDDGGGREAAADRPQSVDPIGFFVCDRWMERKTPMSTAAVEGTDADDALLPLSSAMDRWREIRTPWSSVADGTEERRVFTTRGCGFDSCTQSL